MNTGLAHKTRAETLEPAETGPAAVASTLGLLVSVAEAPKVSQRSLAGRMGVALGLANAYLRRAAAKGWIKVRQAPARRFLYYLTPEGFAEKAALTREFLSDSLRFFRRVRGQSTELLAAAQKQGAKRIAFHGCGDLAEIAAISARELGLEIVGVIDAQRNVENFAELPVFRDLESCGPVDAVLITDINDPQASFDALKGRLADDRILVMALLHVVREAVREDDALSNDNGAEAAS